MAAILRRREHQISLAPPPTPIATGKGSRSAAVDDRVLTEYLENSLKIPDLTLPGSNLLLPTSRFRHRPQIPPEIHLPSLLSGDEASVRWLIESAADIGAFRIDGHDVLPEDLQSVIQLAGEVFRTLPEMMKRRKKRKRREALDRYFGWRREGVLVLRREFFWTRPTNFESEIVLQELWPNIFGTLRARLEDISEKMEGIAEKIGEILSDHMRTLPPHHENKKRARILGEVGSSSPSVLCLRKYDEMHHLGGFEGFQIYGAREYCPPQLSHHELLSLYLSCDDHEFCVRSEDGDIISSFNVPAGSIVVTLSKHLQEWCNGEFKGIIGEPIFELSHGLNPSFSLEFMCSPTTLTDRLCGVTKIVSLSDQLLTALLIVFIYNLWTYISSKIG